MKQLLIYLLISCLFFVKGNNTAVSETVQYLHCSSVNLQIQQANNAEFTTPQAQAYLSELSLITDDNDDDEFSQEKKKTTGQPVAAVYNNIFFVSFNTCYLKTPAQSFNNICYTFPSKYIFHRAIRI